MSPAIDYDLKMKRKSREAYFLFQRFLLPDSSENMGQRELENDPFQHIRYDGAPDFPYHLV